MITALQRRQLFVSASQFVESQLWDVGNRREIQNFQKREPHYDDVNGGGCETVARDQFEIFQFLQSRSSSNYTFTTQSSLFLSIILDIYSQTIYLILIWKKVAKSNIFLATLLRLRGFFQEVVFFYYSI